MKGLFFHKGGLFFMGGRGSFMFVNCLKNRQKFIREYINIVKMR